MQYGKAFAAGFVATLLFHQSLFWLLTLKGGAPYPPWDLTPVPPFGVPKIISLSFWAGVWGVVLWPLVRRFTGGKYFGVAISAGALGPTALSLLVIFPLKGMPILGGGDPKLIVGAMIINGFWGLGYALLLRLMRARP
jgi:hypothetical protein